MNRTKRNTLVITLLVSWLFCIGLYAQSTMPMEYDGSKDHLHIYLLIGQSNMAGRAPISEQDTYTIPRCYLLNGADKFEPAKNPFNRHSTIRKSLDMQRMNPGYSFAQVMLKKDSEVSIGLVVNARGGTRIEHWKKGTHFYNEALSRAREAKKTGTLKGILWHQGEGNSREPDTYLDKLKNLILNLRQDLTEPKLPFVAGQVYYHPDKKPYTQRINDRLAELPDTVPFTGCVESKYLTTFDNTHFDTQGMKRLGKRYAEEMLKIQLRIKAEDAD